MFGKNRIGTPLAIVALLIASQSSAFAMGKKQTPIPAPQPNPGHNHTTIPIPERSEDEVADELAQCLQCHRDKAAKSMHEPVMMFGCTLCHVAHEDRNTKMLDFPRLKALTNDICMSCHSADQIYQNCGGTVGCGHPVQNHPIYGEQDPLYPNKKFTCASCHNPHGSAMPKLFRYDYSEKTVYKGLDCAVCHWGTVMGGNPPPRPAWD